MPIKGLEKDTMSLANQASFFRNFMDPLMSSIPVMRAMKPRRIRPIFRVKNAEE